MADATEVVEEAMGVAAEGVVVGSEHSDEVAADVVAADAVVVDADLAAVGAAEVVEAGAACPHVRQVLLPR